MKFSKPRSRERKRKSYQQPIFKTVNDMVECTKFILETFIKSEKNNHILDARYISRSKNFDLIVRLISELFSDYRVDINLLINEAIRDMYMKERLEESKWKLVALGILS